MVDVTSTDDKSPSFVVAYYVPHNEGVVTGIIDGPGFDSELTLIDLYEVDASIRSFADRAEAQAWLDRRMHEHEHGPSISDLEEEDL